MTLRDEASHIMFYGYSLNHCASASGSSLNFAKFIWAHLCLRAFVLVLSHSSFLPTSLMDLISHHLDLHGVINCSGKISLTTSLLSITLCHILPLYTLSKTYYLKLSYLCIWLLLIFNTDVIPVSFIYLFIYFLLYF